MNLDSAAGLDLASPHLGIDALNSVRLNRLRLSQCVQSARLSQLHIRDHFRAVRFGRRHKSTSAMLMISNTIKPGTARAPSFANIGGLPP